jgi:hypothetical protein
VLLPALAVLQYRWVGQVSTAERERMQRNVRTAAEQFREAFDTEVIRAAISLQVGPQTAQEGASDRYTDRYDTWLNTAAHPQIVAEIFLLDEDRGLRLRRWNADTHAFDTSDWPAVLAPWRSQFEQELAEFRAGHPNRRPPFRGQDSLIVTPLRNRVVQTAPAPGPQTVTPVFGFTIIQLNMAYIKEQMLPELAQRHFAHADDDLYRVAVVAAANPKEVLFKSDPTAPIDPAHADATSTLLASMLLRADPFLFGRPPRPPLDSEDRLTRIRPPDAPGPGPRPEDAIGRWRVLVQHQRGSLEAAVSRVRRQNLAISFGILLLLTLSVALLAAASRRAHRLAFATRPPAC